MQMLDALPATAYHRTEDAVRFKEVAISQMQHCREEFQQGKFWIITHRLATMMKLIQGHLDWEALEAMGNTLPPETVQEYEEYIRKEDIQLIERST